MAVWCLDDDKVRRYDVRASGVVALHLHKERREGAQGKRVQKSPRVLREGNPTEGESLSVGPTTQKSENENNVIIRKKICRIVNLLNCHSLRSSIPIFIVIPISILVAPKRS